MDWGKTTMRETANKASPRYSSCAGFVQYAWLRARHASTADGAFVRRSSASTVVRTRHGDRHGQTQNHGPRRQHSTGTLRPSKPAGYLLGLLQKDERIEPELVDLRDFPLPMFDRPMSPMRVSGGDYGDRVANAWGKKVDAFDAFVMTAAEYNHGYTAVLKNAIDWLYHEWCKKPVAFLGYGSVGGARAVEQLRQVAIEMQMAPIKTAVHVPVPVLMATRPVPAPVNPALFAPIEPQATAMKDELVWWASALREARRKG